MAKRLMVAVACAAAGFGLPRAGAQDLPKPEVYLRAEDQERARLLKTPCTDADVGHGCFRFDHRAVREFPCTRHIEPGVIGSVPTDQCYKMEAPRRYRGIWIDEFEGQRFIPEGTIPPKWPEGDPQAPGWREQFDRARAASIWLNVERAKLPHRNRRGGRRVLIEFVGRKTLYPGAYGHMGMSGNEIIVDRVISVKELK